MYGSQFHFEQNLAVRNYTTSSFSIDNYEYAEIKKTKWVKLLMFILGMTISFSVLASPSEPRTRTASILESFER